MTTGQTGLVILDQTPFYATSGGQIGDKGILKSANCTLEVLDCQKEKDVHLHHVHVTQGTLKANESVTAQVNESERRDIAANHSATHLLHASLRRLLGTHVQQAGSLVEVDRLRFDFTHPEALKWEQVEEIEAMVNAEIARGVQLETKQTSYADAVSKEGAIALFGEKYGDTVRVIRMGNFSTELCGGTHVRATSDIRLFKIVSEGGVSAGVRRIEAITGRRAFEFLNKAMKETWVARSAAGLTTSWAKYLGLDAGLSFGLSAGNNEPAGLMRWVEDRKEQIKILERQIKQLKGGQIDVDHLIGAAKSFHGVRVVTADVEIDDRDVLSQLTDRLRDKLQSGIVVVVGRGADSHPILVSVSKDLVSKYNAGKILKEFAGILGGKGGGRPDFAQGAGSSLAQLPQAWSKLEQLVQ